MKNAKGGRVWQESLLSNMTPKATTVVVISNLTYELFLKY